MASDRTSKKKLDIATLTSVLNSSANFGTLKKKLEKLEKPSVKQKNRVSAPLPKLLQQKIDRAAAYKTVSKDISKWTSVIKQNRESDNLSFPLNAPPKANPSSRTLASQFHPTGKLEEAIASILKNNGMATEQQIQKKEEMALNTVSVEEVKARRAELAKMRSLMFFHEQKMRRIKKIKSKSYRKVLKKEKAKKAELLIEAAGQMSDDEEAEKAKLRMEVDRAKERMTLKHKNAGKLGNNFFKDSDRNPETIQEIHEQLDRHENLKRKIVGSESEDADDTNVEDDDEIEEKEEEVLPTKGLFAMKFMQKAAEKKKAQVQEMLLNDVSTNMQNIFSDSNEDEDDNDDDFKLSEQKYQSEDEDELKVELEPAASKKQPEAKTKLQLAKDLIKKGQVVSSVENPWIKDAKTKISKRAPKVSSTKNIVLDSLASENIVNLDIDLPVLQQKELVAQAFATDNLVADFEAEKAELASVEAPKVEDLTLAGWGTWGGLGTTPTQTKVVKLPAAGQGIDPSKRKDAKLKHVIINEKKPKGLSTYTLATLPFPFTDRSQYERSLAQPVGREWNTTTMFQKKIQPRIQIKAGTVIEPPTAIPPNSKK